ncbi:MAG: hypothetical protein LBO73_03290 [Holosporaceae bacterium]|jgi:opacity protein-like surface antigen|nr:hypothetical protein [Holosporaceae bacterium]
MKRLLFTAVLGVVGFSAGAEEVVVEDVSSSEASPFHGVYLSLGAGGSFLTNKNWARVESRVESRVELGDEEEESEGRVLNFEHNTDRFFGTFAIGSGWTFCKRFYFGSECLVDFGRSVNRSIAGGVSAKTRGVVPEFALRFGYVTKGWMFYVKPAVLFPKVTYQIEDEKYAVSKAGYSVALGVDRSFCKKFSARLEGEYAFRRNEKHTAKEGAFGFKVGKGINVRALVSYNILH